MATSNKKQIIYLFNRVCELYKLNNIDDKVNDFWSLDNYSMYGGYLIVVINQKNRGEDAKFTNTRMNSNEIVSFLKGMLAGKELQDK